MLGLDDRIAALSHGYGFAVVIAVAVLLGLRHATDPDHLTAVSTLMASDKGGNPRRAGLLGGVWGLGHATSLIVFGVPIVLFRSYLPEVVQEGAELVVGLVIVALAVRLLVRTRRPAHRHVLVRSPLQAFGIGLVHGTGGSAGIGVLLLAAIPGRAEALIALAVFAAFTALSMTLVSTAFGYALSREAVVRRFSVLVPAMGAFSLAFGLWYALGAVNAVPYVF